MYSGYTLVYNMNAAYWTHLLLWAGWKYCFRSRLQLCQLGAIDYQQLCCWEVAMWHEDNWLWLRSLMLSRKVKLMKTKRHFDHVVHAECLMQITWNVKFANLSNTECTGSNDEVGLEIWGKEDSDLIWEKWLNDFDLIFLWLKESIIVIDSNLEDVNWFVICPSLQIAISETEQVPPHKAAAIVRPGLGWNVFSDNVACTVLASIALMIMQKNFRKWYGL